MLKPVNRNIVVESAKSTKKSKDNPYAGLAMPLEATSNSTLKVYKIIERADDCTFVKSEDIGRNVIITSSTIDRLEWEDQTYNITSEKFIIGFID